tara:strand:+ start:5476 stop:5871 length:396 start_codon:yes stop_codon:yes gene_type:complete
MIPLIDTFVRLLAVLYPYNEGKDWLCVNVWRIRNFKEDLKLFTGGYSYSKFVKGNEGKRIAFTKMAIKMATLTCLVLSLSGCALVARKGHCEYVHDNIEDVDDCTEKRVARYSQVFDWFGDVSRAMVGAGG